MSSIAGDGFEHQLLANSIGILVVASGTVAPVYLWFVDGVQRANCTSSLENELVAGTGQLADSTAAQSVSSDAHALAVGDHLVGSTGVAVSIGVKNLVTSALAGTHGSLQHFAGRALASAQTVVDQGFGAG